MKWMKIAAIFGFIFIFLNLFVMIIWDKTILSWLIDPFILIHLILLLLLPFFFGFVKLGKELNSSSLKLMAWISFVFVILNLLINVFGFRYFIETNNLFYFFGLVDLVFFTILLRTSYKFEIKYLRLSALIGIFCLVLSYISLLRINQGLGYLSYIIYEAPFFFLSLLLWESSKKYESSSQIIDKHKVKN